MQQVFCTPAREVPETMFQAKGYRVRQLPSQRNLSAREEKAPGRASYTHAVGGGHTGLSFLGYKMSSGADGMTVPQSAPKQVNMSVF